MKNATTQISKTYRAKKKQIINTTMLTQRATSGARLKELFLLGGEHGALIKAREFH
jgi:hypothetical protein